MRKPVPHGDCWFCEGYVPLEKDEFGTYRCKYCKTNGMTPTSILLIEMRELDHV